jgi:hypothetical protein
MTPLTALVHYHIILRSTVYQNALIYSDSHVLDHSKKQNMIAVYSDFPFPYVMNI